MTEPMTLTEESVPRLPRHVKFRHDPARDAWVLLAPERVLAPDPVAVTVLQRLDGERTVGQVVDGLAREFDADRAVIASDVIAMLQGLADKGFLTA